MTRKSSLIFLVLLMMAGNAEAQRRRQQAAPARKPAPRQQPVRMARTDTTIKSTTLEVYQEYEPELKPISKPELSPTLPPPPAVRTPQQYDVPQQTLYYSYQALPIRPLALGKDTGSATMSNYALLGGGNLSTIIGEVGIGSLKGRNWQSLIHSRYITQEGNLTGQMYKEFRLGANAVWQGKGYSLDAALGARYRRYGQYGFDHELYNYSEDYLKRRTGSYGLSIGLQQTAQGVLGLDYHPRVHVSVFSATGNNTERHLGFELPVSKAIDSNLRAELGLQLLLTRLDAGPSGELSNNIFQLRPGVSYTRGAFSGHLRLSPAFGKGGTAYLLPDISAAYQLSRERIRLTAGWLATLRQNSLEQLMDANPFILPVREYRQSRSDEVFAGISFALGRHLTVWGRAGWWQYHSLPLFITYPGGDGKDFSIIHDPLIEALVWSAGARYAVAEDFSLSASGIWTNFYKHSYESVWGEPRVRLKGDISWRILRDLRITAYAEILDRIRGRNAQGADVRLRGVFEFGAAAEYTVIERLGLFLRAENLLGRRNERWLGYPSFGFNIYGGARFRF